MTGLPTLVGEGTDGTDAVRIGFGGEISFSPAGSGFVRLWAESGLEVEESGATCSNVTGWHELDIFGPPATLRWRVPANGSPGGRFLLDSVSLNADPAARWGNRLGTEADAFWFVRTSAPLEITGDPAEAGRKIIRPTAPWPDAGQSTLTAISTLPNTGGVFLRFRERSHPQRIPMATGVLPGCGWQLLEALVGERWAVRVVYGWTA